MVKGRPQNCKEANPILDRLVQKAFLYIADHPDHVKEHQPPDYLLNKSYDRELTDILKDNDLISTGYVAVLSGTTTRTITAEKDFVRGNYNLIVYALPGQLAWERPGKVNVHLSIFLQKGTEPGLQNAVGEYLVDEPYTVIFEEKKNIMGGWTYEMRRPIEISPKYQYDDHPSGYLWGLDDNPLFDKTGNLLVDALQPRWRPEISIHPPGTVYKQGDLPHRVDVFFPKKQ